MSETLQAKIRVISTNKAGQIADAMPQPFRQPDVNQIAAITNQIVVQLQNNLQVAPLETTKTAESLTLSEVELTFGLDLEAEFGTDLKVPIIGPVVHGGVKAGATFEVHIKLARGGA